MLIASGYRFHPRSSQERERARRDAALRAHVVELADRIHALEKEQRIQFKRMADMQATIDELLRLLKKTADTVGT